MDTISLPSVQLSRNRAPRRQMNGSGGRCHTMAASAVQSAWNRNVRRSRKWAEDGMTVRASCTVVLVLLFSPALSQDIDEVRARQLAALIIEKGAVEQYCG